MSLNSDSLRINFRDDKADILIDSFNKDSFIQILQKANLNRIAETLDSIQAGGMLEPLQVGNKSLYHYGHFFTAVLINQSTHIHYDVTTSSNYDLEDVMMRRAALCDIQLSYAKEDTKHINNVFAWILKATNDFDILDVVHSKQALDLLLDELDPSGFYQKLASQNANHPSVFIVSELTKLQKDIEELMTDAFNEGADKPETTSISERKFKLNEFRSYLEPVNSPFLAAPSRDIMVDERRDFIKARNDFMIKGDYAGLVEHYENNSSLFDNEIERHAEYCVALGHISGDLLKDNVKAAECFKEALEYDPNNSEAFNLVSKHLREASSWDELVELLSNHWDAVDDASKRCEMLLECANIQAFHCQNIDEAIGLYERCLTEGAICNRFDEIYKIVYGLMSNSTELQKLRVLVILTAHIINYNQKDKITSLQADINKAIASSSSDDSAARCLNALIEAGITSFSGDQPSALESIREAYTHAPTNTLIDGILFRIASKMNNITEFNEAMDDIESEAIPVKDLSNVLCRIAKVLVRIPKRSEAALLYAERAVDVDDSNNEAIELCYKLSTELNNNAIRLVYASLKLAHTTSSDERAELETICDDLKVAIGDQNDSLIAVYEKCLHFESLRNSNSFSDELKNLISSLPDAEAVSMLQRVESQCVTNGLKSLVGELYESVLERDIANDIRKSLLERYLGMLSGQNDDQSRNTFVRIHAQLFTLTPTPNLKNMLDKITSNDEQLIRTWTGLIEDALPSVSDKVILTRLNATLMLVFRDTLKDDEKAAEAATNILNLEPASIAAFKINFDCYERLERFFDCCELCQKFPVEKLSEDDKRNYFNKALHYALINLYDTEKILFALKTLVANNPQNIVPMLQKIVDWQEQSDLTRDQLLCFFETMEASSDNLLASAMRVFRAEGLAKESRNDEIVNILVDEALKATLKDNDNTLNLVNRVKSIIEGMPESDERTELINLWDLNDKKAEQAASEKAEAKQSTEAPAVREARPTHASSETIDALVRECRDNLDDDNTAIIIENALKTMPPEDQTSLCLKLATACEEKKMNPQAEAYYKRAFQYTQSFELLEFYKRNRMFKKALKIAAFKTAKAQSKTAKAASIVDTALIYEAQRDYANAAKTLDEVINNYADAYATNDLISILRQRAAFAIVTNDSNAAIDNLNKAADLAKNDKKLRGEIDVDLCLLLRETGNNDEARKKWQSLILNNVKSPRLSLLNLCFDVDNNKLAEAEKKYNALIDSVTGTPLEVSVLEQYLRIKQLKDEKDEIKTTAERILALDPANVHAQKALA